MSSTLFDISISSRKKIRRGNKILAHLNRKRRKDEEPKLIFLDEPYLNYLKPNFGNYSIKVNMWNEKRLPKR